MKRYLRHFKTKYNIKSDLQLFLIFCAFSLAGPSDTMTIRAFLHSALKSFHHVPAPAYVFIYIMLAVPMYQFFLLVYGSLLGQFKFFWEREKQIGRFLRKMILRQPGVSNAAPQIEN